MSNRIKTPLQVLDFIDRDGYNLITGDGNNIGVIDDWDIAWYIVHCVNSHDALVEALKDISCTFCCHCERVNGCNDDSRCDRYLRIKQALTNAQEGE